MICLLLILIGLFSKPQPDTPEPKKAIRIYDFETPGLSQWYTYGRTDDYETASIVLNIPEEDYHRVIVDHIGRFRDFPGIERGDWTSHLVLNIDLDAGAIRFRTEITRHGDGYLCHWQLQPDGRYWADDDGFGGENDDEIYLYALLDSKGRFTTPFRICSIGAEKMVELDH